MNRDSEHAPQFGVGEPVAGRIGPILLLQGLTEQSMQLAVLLARPVETSVPVVTAQDAEVREERLLTRRGWTVSRYRFTLPTRSGGRYDVDGQSFEVAGIPSADADLRLAYVSCNGQEHGDRLRSQRERNTMWARLTDAHRQGPLSLLLQGGDQLYADEILGAHPDLAAWAASRGDDRHVLTASPECRERLRDELLLAYLHQYGQTDSAWLMARVPSLCMWDDHDICDGWGSLAPSKLDSEVGQELFRAAREFFLLFQAGCGADELLPIHLDSTGRTLSWAVRLPELQLIAPDLRSERRPNQVLGPRGWETFAEALTGTAAPRTLVLFSTPLLGPRLSWIETLLMWCPGLQKYEDDLRDQWQSRYHRESWRRMLRMLRDLQRENCLFTILSGEIHLAARATMQVDRFPIHQLIASGITHPPPPRAFGVALGLLARLGEAPLAEHPIRLYPLPGQRAIYTAERNYLLLERRGGVWTARWDLEHSGMTPPLEL